MKKFFSPSVADSTVKSPQKDTDREIHGVAKHTSKTTSTINSKSNSKSTPRNLADKKDFETNQSPVLHPETGDATFFLICAPGLEDVTAREIHEFFPKLKPEVERGGVLVNAPIASGLEMNRWLKTPTRILLRLQVFGCRDFPKLFKKVTGFPWELWISDQTDVKIHASSHGSRVKMKKRIEETCRDARIFRLRKRGRPHARFSGVNDIFVRLDDDVCTLSLDTSGEILHKRGTRRFSSEAPLRETLAAALIRLMIEAVPVSKDAVLFDPMTGGGTFLLEAAGLSRPINSRAFAFESFAEDRRPPPLEYQESGSDKFSHFIGIDIEPKAIEAARQNLMESANTSSSIKVSVGDIFKVEPLELSSGLSHCWVIANPPYDERIAVGMRLSEFYEKFFAACERVARPKAACFLLPEKCHPEKLNTPLNWKLLLSRKLENGGLPVVALVYGRKG